MRFVAFEGGCDDLDPAILRPDGIDLVGAGFSKKTDPVARATRFVDPYIVEGTVASRDRPENEKT